MPAGRRPVKPQAPAGKLEGAPWFDLDHYRGVATWTREEWYRAIACRLFVASEPKSCLDKHWPAIAHDCVRCSGYYSSESDQIARIADRDSFGAVGTVPDLEFGTLERVDDLLCDLYFKVLVVDLGRPDQSIRDAFSDWLEKQRVDMPSFRRVMTDDDIKNWVASRVMPYIDIHLFELATSHTFPRVDIYRAIFGDWDITPTTRRDPKTIFDQSTKLYASRLLSRDHFAQIARELGAAVPK